MSIATEPTNRAVGGNSKQAFLAFSLGPVQTFIATARTLRDLWTGSYLLSWLTLQAARPLLEAYSSKALVFPALEGNPLWQWYSTETARTVLHRETDKLVAPCLPNLFLAEVPVAESQELARKCEAACRQAWCRVANATRQSLQQRILEKSVPWAEGWDRLWDSQIDSFFDVRTVVLPWSECDPVTLDDLLGSEDGIVANADDSSWPRRWELLGRLIESSRTVRHVPDYCPEEVPSRGAIGLEKFPAKCSLFGSYEQMGPAERGQSRAFWDAMTGFSVSGSRLTQADRFCAIGLVKRFAWPAFFSAEFNNIRPDKHRYSDTATLAATLWLKQDPLLSCNGIHDWSGQWLHWRQRDQEKQERPVPDAIWNTIQAKRKQHGAPPAYYAILAMDGDRMGEKLRRSGGRSGHDKISRALARFALDIAPRIVEHHHGGLIYAGGDDVLAFLPSTTALACARELEQAFAKNWQENTSGSATVSAGLAVVHYKEDLRFALDAARSAERQAKQAGRDTLQITICRRSGEHSSAPCPWNFVDIVVGWIEAFEKGASDRWAYHLAGELSTLEAIDSAEMIQAEMKRQINRAENTTREKFAQADQSAGDVIVNAFKVYDAELREKQTDVNPGKSFRRFVALVQSASFLTRGKD